MDSDEIQPQDSDPLHSANTEAFQTPYQPGQFRQSPYSPQQPRQRRKFRQWYRVQTKTARILLGCLPFYVAFFLCIGSFTVYGIANPQPPTQKTLATSVTHNNPTNPSRPTETPTALVSILPTETPTTAPSPTPTATATPMPKPTSGLTPKPTAKPTQPPPSLVIAFTCAVAVDYSYGNVCVHTLSGAALTITVTYCSGYDATSSSLKGTEHANSAGNYEWSWVPETKCRGAATASVTAAWSGQNTSNSDGFNVQ